MSETQSVTSEAETSAVTAPTVVAGLGYPVDRKETSLEPAGWNVSNVEFDANVSREDRAWSSDALSESCTGNLVDVSRETSKDKSKTLDK